MSTNMVHVHSNVAYDEVINIALVSHVLPLREWKYRTYRLHGQARVGYCGGGGGQVSVWVTRVWITLGPLPCDGRFAPAPILRSLARQERLPCQGLVTRMGDPWNTTPLHIEHKLVCILKRCWSSSVSPKFCLSPPKDLRLISDKDKLLDFSYLK